MKARLYYLNPSLGDTHLYFRKGNKILFIYQDIVHESAITLSRFYRWLKEGVIVKKKTPTVFINGNRSVEKERIVNDICVKWNLTPDQLFDGISKIWASTDEHGNPK